MLHFLLVYLDELKHFSLIHIHVYTQSFILYANEVTSADWLADRVHRKKKSPTFEGTRLAEPESES